MKRIAGWLKGLLGLGALAALTMLLIALFSQATNPAQTPAQGGESVSPIETPLPTATDISENARPTPRPPTAAPPGYVPVYTGTPPTSTPRPGEIRPSADVSTPTSLPISKSVDLAEGLPDEDKSVYIIQRSSGVYEEYLIPADYSGDVRSLMELGPNDMLIYHYPLKPRPSTPVLTTPVPATPTQGPLVSPLPTPITGPTGP